MISGISANLNKFDVQANLTKNFSKNNFKTKSVTYNPEGALYGFDIFKYSSKVVFPDIVCSINQYMCYTEEKTNLDAWIINIGGGCFFINNQNRNFRKACNSLHGCL